MSDKDIIYRQDAIDAIKNIKAITGTFDDEILLIDKVQAQTELMMLPSAEPRKKGKWVELTNTNHSYICSVCGRMLVNITDGKNKVTKSYPFCHCGEDMREDT